MHGPVGPRLAIFARAVDRVHNPDADCWKGGQSRPFLLRQEPSSGRCSISAWIRKLVGDVHHRPCPAPCRRERRLPTSIRMRPAVSARRAASSASCIAPLTESAFGRSVRPPLRQTSCRIDADLRRFRRLVGAVDPGEVLELARRAPFCRGPSRRAFSASSSGVSM